MQGRSSLPNELGCGRRRHFKTNTPCSDTSAEFGTFELTRHAPPSSRAGTSLVKRGRHGFFWSERKPRFATRVWSCWAATSGDGGGSRGDYGAVANGLEAQDQRL